MNVLLLHFHIQLDPFLNNMIMIWYIFNW